MTRLGGRTEADATGPTASVGASPGEVAGPKAAAVDRSTWSGPAHRRGPGPGALRDRLRPLVGLWRPLAILVAARVAMYLAIFTFSHLFHHYTLNPWDGGWYVYAAQHGWPHHVKAGLGGAGQDTLAFFPAFPTVIRIVHFIVPVTWMRAGEAAAFLCEVAMVAGVWLLIRDLWGRSVADRGAVLLCFFPGSFILAMMYSEPLTIATAAFAMLALRRRQWVLAGVLSAVCAATRVIGVAMIAACLWEALVVIRRERRWESLLSVAIAPLAVVAWFVYLWRSTGDWMAWLHTERNGWAQHTTVMAIPDLIKAVAHTHPADMNEVLALAGTALGIVLLIVLVASRPPAMFTVYSAAVLVLAATSTNPAGIRFRFVLTAFPLVVVLGRYLKDAALTVAVSMSSVVMGVILVVTLMGPALIP
ncbi:MAG: hypothetical protein M0Z30_06715 [Actinomycetota bacterium]|nr:hypothetical protein [Actinomycetota bacterium]